MDDNIRTVVLGLFVQVVFTITIRELRSTGLWIAAAVALPFAFLVFLRPYAPLLISKVVSKMDTIEIVDSDREDHDESTRTAHTNTNEGEGPMRDSENCEQLTDVVYEFGIRDGSRQLKDSKYEPLSVINNTQNSLAYMGIAAPKWIEERKTREEFKNMLRHVSEDQGTVRFLLLDPEWEGYAQYITLEGSIEQTVSHFKYFSQLQNTYDNFSVRLYRSKPICRLIFKDNDFGAISRYQFEGDVGWQHPHLEIDKNSDYTLYQPLMNLYNFYWEQAKPMPENAEYISED